MGLQEKVWVKKWQDEGLPALKKHFTEQTGGGELAIEVDWDSVMTSPNASNNFQGTALFPLRDAIYTIARNAVGKQALKDGFKKVVYKNAPPGTPKAVKFESGTLSVTADFATDSKSRINEHDLRTALEAGL